MGNCGSLDKEKVNSFPEEIFAEILSWLEAKYLFRYKCVCKVWYSLIMSKLFVDMHAARNGTLHSDWTRENFSFESKYCRGLLLKTNISLSRLTPAEIAASRIRNPENIRIRNPNTYQIRNPTIKLILNLPRPHYGEIYMDIFHYPSTNSYYVVSVFFHHVNKRYFLELLDLGGQSNDPCPNADLTWKIVKIPVFDMLSRQGLCHFSYCMSREGILHILTSPTVGFKIPRIMCIDLVKQTCEIIKVPHNLYFNCRQLKFQSWMDKPSVVFVREEKLNILVLEDYKEQKWADTMVIPLPFLEQHPILMTEIPHIHRDNGDEEDILVYLQSPVNCRLYTVKSGSVCIDPPPPRMRITATLVSLKDNSTSIKTEKDSISNANSTRGFDLVDNIKAALENS